MIGEIIGLSIISAALYSFFLEQKEVDRARDSISIRIHVNGIRGKTTVTRMIGAALRPKFRTLTKTTGSEPKIILPDGSEKLIERKGLVNIKEQIEVLKIAYKNNAECIVFECMALEPSFQKILEEKVMRSTIGVITNIRYDHEDVMGESLESITTALCNTIPYNSHLVVIKDIQCLHIIESVAKEKNTTIHYADINEVPKGYAQKFDFMNFDENIALALETTKIVGIEKDIALKNMLHTRHDIGRGWLHTRFIGDKAIHFLNSFANNDVQSLVKMLSRMKYKGGSKKIALLSHREDRVRRTLSIINFVCDYGFDSIVISSDSMLIEDELRESGFKGEIVTTSKNFIDVLNKLSDKKENYWIGLANIKTPFAENVLNYFGVT